VYSVHGRHTHITWIEGCLANGMNWEHIKADWLQTKGKIKSKWGKLTDDNLTTISGKWDQLVAKLHERYGYKRDQAEREVDSFLRSLDARKSDDKRDTTEQSRH
jgi:uncharacterized protein YjbJ (UPF0337 family)